MKTIENKEYKRNSRGDAGCVVIGHAGVAKLDFMNVEDVWPVKINAMLSLVTGEK